jgi:two-component system OmpR family response regulator
MADTAMRVLIVEDDKKVSVFIHNGLVQAGHEADVAHNGDEGLNLALQGDYDVLVLDRMLPGKDGVTIITQLREEGVTTPTLFLSALGHVDDRVTGLRAGAEDYLTKPFAFEELLARLEVLYSRSEKSVESTTKIQAQDLELDLLTRKVHRGGQEIPLQSREFKLLEFLLNNKGQIITRTMLLEKVWDYNFDPQTNIIDVHISRLRNKVDKGFDNQIIETVRGAGYRIVE